MTIKHFAQKYRLRTAEDVDNTTIIPGKSGQIYENGDASFGVIFHSPVHAKTREVWNNRRRAALAAGFELNQDGDYEGSLLFNPANEPQARHAIKLARIRTKKILSEEQLNRLKQTAFQKRA